MANRKSTRASSKRSLARSSKSTSTRTTRRKKTPQTVEFHLIKSNHFRVIHADGAWGGISPQGYIRMGLYNERLPFPQKVVHSIEKSGLGKEVKREGKAGVIREIEVDVILDENCAIALHKWLGEKISSLQQAREAISNA